MPIVGGRSIRTCLQCGSPYCGPGNGSPGPNCPRSLDRKVVNNSEPLFSEKKCTCKSGPLARITDIYCPKHGSLGKLFK